jgi:hypothetical protein
MNYKVKIALVIAALASQALRHFSQDWSTWIALAINISRMMCMFQHRHRTHHSATATSSPRHWKMRLESWHTALIIFRIGCNLH